VFRLTILESSCFALAMSDHEEAHSLHSPELGGQHFEITNFDDSDESDESIPLSKEKSDACSTSEGADTEQKQAYEAQKLEEEIYRRSQICAKRVIPSSKS
jgi:hypothetical protein